MAVRPSQGTTGQAALGEMINDKTKRVILFKS